MLEKSIDAMLAAIEIYNKPNFPYREEAFSVLAVNAWELLLKAYWLKVNDNDLQSLYVMQPVKKADGSLGKRMQPKLTRSSNPLTHSVDYVAEKLVERKSLERTAWSNIQAIIAVRDTAIHFYNKSDAIAAVIYELCAASTRNFFDIAKAWFYVDLDKFSWFLMPLAFVKPDQMAEALIVSKEEKNLLAFVNELSVATGGQDHSQFAIEVKLNFVKAKGANAIDVALTKDQNAVPVIFTEEQIKQRWPLTYQQVMDRSRERYVDFKANAQFNSMMNAAKADPKFSMKRELDPGNPKTSKKYFFSNAIFGFLDVKYVQKT
jgi:hypothetical protein